MTLLVALAVHAANATEQITKLTIGKFFLHCKGDCSTESKFRDKGYLSFGTDKKVIKNQDRDSIYTYHIINDFPDTAIPHYCIDGSPAINIGKKLGIIHKRPYRTLFKTKIIRILMTIPAIK